MRYSLWLALAGCEDPQDGPDRPPRGDAASEALDALRDASASPVGLTASYGVPSAVTFQVPLADDDPIDAAYGFLETWAALYGLDDARAQLWPASDQGPDGTHIRFVQRTPPEQGGLPLFNSWLTVHSLDGTAYMTTGRWIPGLRAAPPVLTAEQALAQVQLDLREVEFHGEPQLGLYAVWAERGAHEVHTVWRTTVTGRVLGTGEAARWRIDLDATTGELVHQVSLITSCDFDLQVMYGSHTDASATCWYGWAETVDWFYEEGMLEDYSSALDHNDDGIEANAHGRTVYDWYVDVIGWCSFDDDDEQVEIVTHADIPNASATGGCDTMQFSDGYTTLDVIAHEFTHLVDANAGDLESSGQSGALDESFADVMASLLDGNWTLGEDVPGGAIRNLASPPLEGHPDHFDNYVSGGDAHVNAGIPNKAAWLAIEGGEHRDYTVDGIGWARGARLFHSAHVASIGGEASFRDARDAVVGTALYWGVIGAHTFSPQHHCQVGLAYAAVGIGVSAADTDCDGVSDGAENDDDGDGTGDAEDGCPHLADPAQSDMDGDGENDACDDDDDGDGVDDTLDGCPTVADPGHADSNGDGIGDACSDRDGDTLLDSQDNCPDASNWYQTDSDGDGWGDVCDPDADGDGHNNTADNCPTVANPDQAEYDGDGFGDACDNCPTAWNPDQDGCACPKDLLERAYCTGAFDPEEDMFVHPLDEVSLPWVDRLDQVIEDDYRLQLTVVGTGQPWMVFDALGDVVAKSSGLVTPTAAIQQASWHPSVDHRYAPDGERAPFATDYTLQFSPDLGTDGVNVRLELVATPVAR
jgi:hypothetical protein